MSKVPASIARKLAHLYKGKVCVMHGQTPGCDGTPTWHHLDGDSDHHDELNIVPLCWNLNSGELGSELKLSDTSSTRAAEAAESWYRTGENLRAYACARLVTISERKKGNVDLAATFAANSLTYLRPVAATGLAKSVIRTEVIPMLETSPRSAISPAARGALLMEIGSYYRDAGKIADGVTLTVQGRAEASRSAAPAKDTVGRATQQEGMSDAMRGEKTGLNLVKAGTEILAGDPRNRARRLAVSNGMLWTIRGLLVVGEFARMYEAVEELFEAHLQLKDPETLNLREGVDGITPWTLIEILLTLSYIAKHHPDFLGDDASELQRSYMRKAQALREINLIVPTSLGHHEFPSLKGLSVVPNDARALDAEFHDLAKRVYSLLVE